MGKKINLVYLICLSVFLLWYNSTKNVSTVAQYIIIILIYVNTIHKVFVILFWYNIYFATVLIACLTFTENIYVSK